MSFFQSLFHHLIDPKLIFLALIAGLLFSSFKLRLIAAFTVGLMIELYFVMSYDSQQLSLFTLATGSIAAYMWMVVASRLKSFFLRYKQ